MTLKLFRNSVVYAIPLVLLSLSAAANPGLLQAGNIQPLRILTCSSLDVATFNVTFQETGLPTELSWYIVLNGVNRSAQSGANINFTERVGNYTAIVGAPPGYSGPGTVDVDGTSVTTVSVTVGFVAAVGRVASYQVLFSESGLPTGPGVPFVNWSVTLNGTVASSGPFQTLRVIGFDEPNGSYFFTVAAPGYNASPRSGTVSVAGIPVQVNVTFTVNGSTGSGGKGSGPPTGGSSPPKETSSPTAFLNSPFGWVVLLIVTTVVMISVVVFYRARGRRIGSPSTIYRSFAVRRVGQAAVGSGRSKFDEGLGSRIDSDALAKALK